MVLSAVLHITLAAAAIAVTFFSGSRSENWGGNSTGDAVNANLISSVPLPQPQHPTENIVANESKGLTQSVPQTPVQEPDAIPIPDKPNKKQDRKAVTTANVKPPITAPPVDTVPFGQGGPVSGPYGTFTTSNAQGGFSMHGEGDFGSRFPLYVRAVRQKVAENWFEYRIDPTTTPHRVYLEFDILKNGTPDNIRISQSSGVPSLDQSAIRALKLIDTFGRLPDGYTGSKVAVEFWFDYHR